MLKMTETSKNVPKFQFHSHNRNVELSKNVRMSKYVKMTKNVKMSKNVNMFKNVKMTTTKKFKFQKLQRLKALKTTKRNTIPPIRTEKHCGPDGEPIFTLIYTTAM